MLPYTAVDLLDAMRSLQSLDPSHQPRSRRRRGRSSPPRPWWAPAIHPRRTRPVGTLAARDSLAEGQSSREEAVRWR